MSNPDVIREPIEVLIPKPIEDLNLEEGDWVTVVNLKPASRSWVFDKDRYKRTFRVNEVSNGFYATEGTTRMGLKSCIAYKATQEDIDKAYWQDWLYIIQGKYIKNPVYKKQISLETAIKYGLENLIENQL